MDTDCRKSETYESLSDFGLHYGMIRIPQPYDTATLDYNWQIWGCQAYSLFSTYTEHIGKQSTQTAVNAVLCFFIAKQIHKLVLHGGMHTRIVMEPTDVFNIVPFSGS